MAITRDNRYNASWRQVSVQDRLRVIVAQASVELRLADVRP